MGKKILRTVYSLPVNLAALLGCCAVLGFYILQNWGRAGERFYLAGYAKFLLFSVAFYVLLMLRIRFYVSIGSYAELRVGKENWMRAIRKIELFLALTYFLVIFMILPFLNGIENMSLFYISCGPLFIIWLLNYFILLFFLDMPGKEVYGAIIPLILLAVYNYAIYPWIYSSIYSFI